MREDYCTASPETIFGIYIGDACKNHDLLYWEGGSEEDRKSADIKFRKELNQKVIFLGWIYYFVVRFFAKSRFEYREKGVKNNG